jgi:3-oxoacyl-[acyl-carrier-protein] synthase II
VTPASAPSHLVVTGVGLVSALGNDVESTWRRIVGEERGIRALTLFDASSYKSAIGAEVSGLREVASDTWSRTAEMGLVAAREACERGKIAEARARGLRVGLVVGATTGGMFETETLLGVLADPRERETTKDEAWRKLLSNPISSTTHWIDAELGPFSRTRTLSSACSSGANAIVVAASWLLLGECDIVLAGGADGLCRLTQAGFGALSACDPEPCRPFDVRRRGLNLGEGAGFVVLERAETARARGAVVACELGGWGIGSEAHHITNPDASGKTPARLLTRALERAGLGPTDLDYINAHGTATPLNDAMESAGIVAALGAEAARVPVSSSKGQLGHTLAAAGAIEAVLTTLALRDGVVPPTVGLEQPDPKCAVRHVPHTERRELRVAASSSFGFGGMDSVIVLAKPGLATGETPERHEVVVVGAASLTPWGLATGAASHEVLAHPLPAIPKVTLDASAFDAARARRLDRLSRLGTLVVESALSGAGLPRGDGEAPYRDRIGLLLGNAWGNLDASAAFMRRVFDKGPRLASPADFPNLVPSSPVGHISIYLGLSGPSFAIVDFAASGEAAFLQGVEMVASGEVRAVCVGGVEEESDIVENVLSRVFVGPREARPVRAEGAGATVLASAELAEERGLPVLARVLSAHAYRTGGAVELAPPAPGAGRSLVVARDAATAARLLEGTAWASCEVLAGEVVTGAHESAGAIFLSAAAGLVASKVRDRVAVVAETQGNAYAVVLG